MTLVLRQHRFDGALASLLLVSVSVNVFASEPEYTLSSKVLTIPIIKIGDSFVYDAMLKLNEAGSFDIIEYSDTAVESRISSAVENIAKNRNIPSLGLAISTKGKNYQFNYHHPDVLNQEIYGIGSITKLLSAVLVMHYFEQKKLDINEKAIKYIDEPDIGHIVGIEDVTVLQLLRHESGISDYANNPVWFERVGENNAPATFDEKMKLVESKLASKGGFSYSNTNYLLLEKIIENVTGLNYLEAFNEYYKSLNIEIEIGINTNELQAFFASTEESSRDVSSLEEYYGFDGGAYTTPQDLLSFFSYLFMNKSILSQESLSMMQSWGPMSPEVPIGSAKVSSYGAGIMHLQHERKSYIGHMGGTLKYQSFAFFNSEDETIVVVMTNSSGRHFNNAFFQELIPTILDEL